MSQHADSEIEQAAQRFEQLADVLDPAMARVEKHRRNRRVDQPDCAIAPRPPAVARAL
jgi:hypothetical protein